MYRVIVIPIIAERTGNKTAQATGAASAAKDQFNGKNIADSGDASNGVPMSTYGFYSGISKFRSFALSLVRQG